MLYELTLDNLKATVKAAGTADIDALCRFFSDAKDAKNVEFYISQMIRTKIFDYDDFKRRVTWHTSAKRKSFAQDDRVKAFWVIASFLSENVKEFLPCDGEGPIQFIAITMDDNAYDIAVIHNALDAQIAANIRKKNQIQGEDDVVNHIAVVTDTSLSDTIARCGFDSFCTLDGDHVPVYSQWS